jgi:hypothetical protein
MGDAVFSGPGSQDRFAMYSSLPGCYALNDPKPETLLRCVDRPSIALF